MEAETLQPSAILQLQRQYESELPTPTPQTSFNYGWCLTKQRDRAEVDKGILMLRDVKAQRVQPVECLYHMAFACVKLEQYGEARGYLRELLALEPGNKEAGSMLVFIEDRIERDGVLGMALVGGVLALSGLLVAGLMRARR